MVIQLAREDWNPICDPVWLCILPLTTKYIERKCNLEFYEVLEEGLGRVLYSVISIVGKTVLLQSCSDGPTRGEDISVCIYGEEEGWDEVTNALCELLDIERASLIWEQTELAPGRWAVIRKNIDGSETEILSAPDEFRAKQCMRELLKSKNGMHYYVRETTI